MGIESKKRGYVYTHTHTHTHTRTHTHTYIYIYETDSFCCTAETNSTLKNDITNKFKIIKVNQDT